MRLFSVFQMTILQFPHYPGQLHRKIHKKCYFSCSGQTGPVPTLHICWWPIIHIVSLTVRGLDFHSLFSYPRCFHHALDVGAITAGECTEHVANIFSKATCSTEKALCLLCGLESHPGNKYFPGILNMCCLLAGRVSELKLHVANL